MSQSKIRATIPIKNNTKTRLDKWRAPGQSYDGFVYQLVSLWEGTHKNTDRDKTGFLTQNFAVTSHC
jgi:hypothetical protein